MPDAPSRARILQLLSQPLKLSPAIDFKVLGQQTPGFVGSDIKALVAEAGMVAVARIVKQFEGSVVGTTTTDLNGTYSDASGMTEEVTGEGDHALITGGVAPMPFSMTDIESLIKQYIFSSSPPTYTVIEPDHNTPTPTVTTLHDTTLTEPTLTPTPTPTTTTIESLLQVQTNQSSLNIDIIQSLYITQADFLIACKSIQPSAKREGNRHAIIF